MASFFPSGMEMPKFGTPKADAMAASSATTGADGLSDTPGATTSSATISGGGSDFWTLAAVAAMEDSDGQARADVAQVIYNRKASGAYGGGTIRELIIADKQFEPTWGYPRKNSAGMIANPEWHNITNAETAAIATGKSVAFINQAAADIQNKQYQDEAKKFVEGRTDFTNYPKDNRKGQRVRSTNKPNNYFGWDWNYKGNTMGGVPNFNTTSTPSTSSQPATTPAPISTPTTPMVERYTSPSQEEAKAKKKVAFFLRASAAIDEKKVEKKGDSTEVFIPGLGKYKSGTGLFGGHMDKYFDLNGNDLTEEVFMKRLKNMENVQRGIMKIEKQKRETAATSAATGTETVMGTKNPDEISGDPATSGGASDPSSVPTGTGLKDTISQRAIDVTYGTPSGPVRTRGRSGHHAGIDIGTGGQKGWYVAFKMKGKVSLISNLSGYGNTVIIEAGGYDFLFAHLARPSELKQGQAYNGEIIGEIGNTGVGSGEHLHFEVRSIGGGTGSDVDPEPFTKHLVIGRMGDGSAVGTTTPSTLPQTTTGPTIAAAPTAGQGISGSPTARNLEQYPSYDDGTKNVLMIAPPGQMPQTRLPSAKRTASAQTNASMSQVLNSYYKRQLLGLLYKVG